MWFWFRMYLYVVSNVFLSKMVFDKICDAPFSGILSFLCLVLCVALEMFYNWRKFKD
jgi:hypothetical protein